MPLQEPVIRPPSEAESFLLQVTLGCSQNTCTFCGAYIDKPFTMKAMAETEADIGEQARYCPDTSRVFLCDGDALVLSNERLVPVLDLLNRTFPKLTRISSYANAHNILNKTPEELLALSERKLSLIYMGLESGSDTVLRSIKKKANASEMIEAVQNAKAAGITAHVIVLLGLGGHAHSRAHIQASAQAVSAMDPRFVSLLSVMLVPGTALYEEARAGIFTELRPHELLQETKWFLEDVHCSRTLFFANHASNYLPLQGRLPKDKNALLSLVDAALTGSVRLKPGFLRGL